MRLCDVPGMSFMLPDPLVEIQTIGSSGMRRDVVPEEVPVALAYNGISHAVMMASPSDLEDFALGFSLSEGLLAKPAELYDLEVESGPPGSHRPDADCRRAFLGAESAAQIPCRAHRLRSLRGGKPGTG